MVGGLAEAAGRAAVGDQKGASSRSRSDCETGLTLHRCFQAFPFVGEREFQDVLTLRHATVPVPDRARTLR
jgi:hypothetical protein